MSSLKDLEVGSAVIVCDRDGPLRDAVVKWLTKLRIETSDGKSWRRSDGCEWGSGSDPWYRGNSVLPATDDLVAQLRVRRAGNRYRAEAKSLEAVLARIGAAGRYPFRPYSAETIDAATEIIEQTAERLDALLAESGSEQETAR